MRVAITVLPPIHMGTSKADRESERFSTSRNSKFLPASWAIRAGKHYVANNQLHNLISQSTRSASSFSLPRGFCFFTASSLKPRVFAC
jgi:hypothetical protein